jgi:hypothetical protein
MGRRLRRSLAIETTVVIALLAMTGARIAAGQMRSGDSLPQWHVHPGLGLRAGAPQGVSLALGGVFGAQWRSGTSHPRSPEFTAFVEPGWNAGRASLGVISFGRLGSGVGVSATVLRTWRDAWWLPENQTYVGGEVWAWPLFFVGPRIGAFHALHGRGGLFITADFGFGL